MPAKRTNAKGFTLVELAVVIVIIGLIIGAVVKGQELIDSARVNAVIAQVNGFRAGFTTFQEKYGVLPGDMAQATTRIPGCTGANCTNGNGDGVIGVNGTNPNVPQDGEGAMAWQHLALANLVTGVVPGAAVGENAYNTNFPGARTGGGFVIIYGAVGTPAITTHWVRLQGTQGNAAPGLAVGAGALTPGQAAVIDRRLDDGNPLTGSVRAGGVAASCTSNGYREDISTKDCNLFFQVQ